MTMLALGFYLYSFGWSSRLQSIYRMYKCPLPLAYPRDAMPRAHHADVLRCRRSVW